MHYILRQGEISLKGKNRKFFVDKLIRNVKRMCRCNIARGYGRLYVETEDTPDFARAFGIVSYSPAIKIEKTVEAIEGEVLRHAKDVEGSFRISFQRSDKDFPVKSQDMNRRLGSLVQKATGAEVNLDNPDLDIGVEVSRQGAFVFTETFECFGGLPVGTEGTVAALIEDDMSLLAALLMMKRGCDVLPVGYEEYDTSLLKRYCCTHDFRKISSLKEIEKAEVAALVAGDILNNYKEYDVNLPILRPVIVRDVRELELFRKHGK